MNYNGRLRGKIALITGGAGGIGAACVRAFVAEGAQVVIGDVDAGHGAALAAECGEAARFSYLDVGNEDSFCAAIKSTLLHWERLDVLVNNAGLAMPAKAVQDTTDEEFDALLRVNLRGTFYGCKLAYPHLKKSRGCVLNISSMAGVTGQERHAIYAATKGAINALTKSTAVDWGRDGIRINALCPTGVWTDALRAWCKAQPDGDSIAAYLDRIHSLGYCPEPEEIASVAAFLCSEEARFITGAIMPVSGGSECGYKL